MKNIISYLLLVIGLGFNISTVAAKQKTTTLGILPFECQVAGEEYRWLSAGISDTLIAKFTGTKGIRIVERERLASLTNVEFLILNDELKGKESISRNSSMEWVQSRDGGEATENASSSAKATADMEVLNRKPNTENWTQAAKQLALLNAQYLLVGSYTIVGEQIRVNARIVHAETAKINGDTALSVKGKISDIFALETELAEKFAKACNLEIAYNKLSYTDGRNTASYELFNRGKMFFADGKYAESVDSFVKSQQQNDGFYFAEAHTWEGKARIALANSTDDQSTKLKVQQAHVAKFEADAAEAAPAFYDLGVALQACGQYEKAIKAYDDYLRWMAQKDKSIHWQKKFIPVALQSQNEPNGDLLFVNNNLKSFALHKGNMLFISDGSRVVAVDAASGETLWSTFTENSSPRQFGGVFAINTVGDFLLFCSDRFVWILDKQSGKVINKIRRLFPVENGNILTENIQAGADGKTALLLSTRRDSGKMVDLNISFINIKTGEAKAIISKRYGFLGGKTFPIRHLNFRNGERRLAFGRVNNTFWYSIKQTGHNIIPKSQNCIDLDSGVMLDDAVCATQHLESLENIFSSNNSFRRDKVQVSKNQFVSPLKTVQSDRGYLATLAGPIKVVYPGETKARHTFKCVGKYNLQRISVSNSYIYTLNDQGFLKKYEKESGRIASRKELHENSQFVTSTDNSLILYGDSGIYSINTSGVSKAKTSAEAIYQIGQCYRAQRKYDLAVNSFKKSLTMDPNMWISYFEMGKTFLEMDGEKSANRNKAFYSFIEYFDFGSPNSKQSEFYQHFLSEQCGVEKRIRHRSHNYQGRSVLSGAGIINEYGYYLVRKNQFFSHSDEFMWELHGGDRNIWKDKLYIADSGSSKDDWKGYREVELRTGRQLREINVKGKPITFIPDFMSENNQYVGHEKYWYKLFMTIADGKFLTSFTENGNTILRMTEISNEDKIAEINLGKTGKFNWRGHSTFCYPVNETLVLLVNCKFDTAQNDHLYMVDVRNKKLIWDRSVGFNLKRHRSNGGVALTNYNNVNVFNDAVYYYSNADLKISIFAAKTGRKIKEVIVDKGDCEFLKVYPNNALFVTNRTYTCSCHKSDRCPEFKINGSTTGTKLFARFDANNNHVLFSPQYGLKELVSTGIDNNSFVLISGSKATWFDKQSLNVQKERAVPDPYELSIVFIKTDMYLRMRKKFGTPTYYKMKNMDIPEIWFGTSIFPRKQTRPRVRYKNDYQPSGRAKAREGFWDTLLNRLAKTLQDI